MYTETLNDFLQHNATRSEQIKTKFAQFPNFTLYDINISMFELFFETYKFKEIGAETEHLFNFYLQAKIDKLAVEFVPKIKVFIENFNTLYSRVFELKESTKNSYYLNPMQENSDEKLVVEDVNKYEATKEHALGYFKSNPQIMDLILKMQSVYNTCNEKFSILFLGVL